MLGLPRAASMVFWSQELKVKNESTTEPAHHHHESDTVNIELDHGEKWNVDHNMMVFIRNMENDVIAFEKSDTLGYASLAIKLQTNIDSLTSNCTMKGKAHDELHKWLLPYIELVTALSEAKDKSEAEKQFQNIRTSFTTFNQYFQWT